jgi:hypothetical protein
VRALRNILVSTDSLTETDMLQLGVDSDQIRIVCFLATELVAIAGCRCWSVSDLGSLLGETNP